MEKIREQAVPGLGMTEWWNLADGCTALVRTRAGRSTIRLLVNAAAFKDDDEWGQPEHWKATQTEDVTEQVAAKALIHGLAALIPNGASLTGDRTPRKHLECSSDDAAPILQQLERAICQSQNAPYA